MLPFEGFLCVLQGNVNTEVMKRLNELSGINSTFRRKKSFKVKTEPIMKLNKTHLDPLTCILLVETLHHQLQVFLVVL